MRQINRENGGNSGSVFEHIKHTIFLTCCMSLTGKKIVSGWGHRTNLTGFSTSHYDSVKPLSDRRFFEQGVEQTVMIVVLSRRWQ